ncbi:MAG: AMP-binding protein [Ilumatobacteraceae bacterium]|jgi:crotonobetaine/carnitine-CoA ligase
MVAPTAIRATATHPFAGRDVPWLLGVQAQARPDHAFIVWEPFDGAVPGRRRWTYSEFAADVAAFAGALAARGVGPGQRVLIHLGNCPEFLIAWFACSHLGAVAVTTNTRSMASELEYFATHSRVVGVVTQPGLLDVVTTCGAEFGFVIVTDTDLGQPASATAGESFDAVLAEGSALEPLPPRRSDALDPNSVQYTSGTTARPKGVVWTHANALWGAKTGAALLELTGDDVTIAFLPLFHTNALSYSMLSTLWSGGTLVIQPKFSASRYWDVVVRNGCTWSSSIPFMLWALMEQPRPESHRLRYWGLGASDLPVIEKAFGMRTLGWFGMTETVTLTMFSEVGKPARRGAMGTVVAGYEVKVVDDDGAPVAFGESGWLKIRGIAGVSLFLEYLDNEEATAAAFDDEGWFDTGDLVTPYADGHIRFDNRGKDMLRVGAENVSAAEVERVIATVAGVRESAVVGRPDRMLDEVPVAFVILAGEPADGHDGLAQRVIETCAAQLAAFKVPREVIIVDEFPRVTLEKVDKKTLRARLAEG